MSLGASWVPEPFVSSGRCPGCWKYHMFSLQSPFPCFAGARVRPSQEAQLASPRGLPAGGRGGGAGAKPSSLGRPVQQDQNLRAEARNCGMLPASPLLEPCLSWHPHQPLCSDPVSLLLSTGGPAEAWPCSAHGSATRSAHSQVLLPPAPANPTFQGSTTTWAWAFCFRLRPSYWARRSWMLSRGPFRGLRPGALGM